MGLFTASGLLASALFGGQVRTPPPAAQFQPGSLNTQPQRPHSECLLACHTPHVPLKSLPKRPADTVDSACLGCHQGAGKPAAAGGADKKLAVWSGLGSQHVAGNTQRRQTRYSRQIKAGSRNLTLRPDCTGCHDVHGKERGMLRSLAFDARGQLIEGSKPVFVAQVCFGCHAGHEAVPTVQTLPDLGQSFGKGAVSSHHIGRTAAERPDLPSLAGTEFKAKLDCVSCHDNPDTNGLKGPHQSSFASLLRASYGKEKNAGSIGDHSNELCYTCHDRYSIQANKSFPLHGEHLNGFTGGPEPARKLDPGRALPLLAAPRNPGFAPGSRFRSGFGEPTPCATCHDPHGSVTNPSLILFDRTVVTPSSVGGVEYYRSGLGHGSCTLKCHGYDHVQTRY